jgi:hypothetical protein
MRHLISGLVAAVAVMAAAPAMACGFNPCGQQFYAAPVPAYTSSGCNPCGGVGYGYEGYGHARLADPEQQYYYVNQGPTYSGPGAWAPARVYQEETASGYGVYHRPYYGYRHHAYRPWHPRVSYYHEQHMGYHHGYAPRHAYAPRYEAAPYRYGHRVLRRYY